MSWVTLDDDFPNHPKTVAAGESAAWLYVAGVCYCRKYHTGGFISTEAARRLSTTNPRARIDALLRVGFWERVEGGFQIHDYTTIYDDEADKAKKEDRTSRRREAGRAGGLAKAAAFPSVGDYWLYLARDANDEWVKVGITTDPHRREIALRSHRSGLTVLTYWALGYSAYSVALQKERAAHSALSEFERQKGELFRVGSALAREKLRGVVGVASELAPGGVASPSKASSDLPQRDGMGSGSVVLPPKNEKERRDETPLDQAFRDFQGAFPSNRRQGGKLIEDEFIAQCDKAGGVRVLMEALANHKASEQWQTPKLVPSMATWLSEERWRQTLDPPKPKVDPRLPAWAQQ